MSDAATTQPASNEEVKDATPSNTEETSQPTDG